MTHISPIRFGATQRDVEGLTLKIPERNMAEQHYQVKRPVYPVSPDAQAFVPEKGSAFYPFSVLQAINKRPDLSADEKLPYVNQLASALIGRFNYMNEQLKTLSGIAQFKRPVPEQ